MWYIYSVEYYAAIKNEIISSAGTWVELGATILTTLMQKQQTKFQVLTCRWELSDENTWTYKGNNTH